MTDYREFINCVPVDVQFLSCVYVWEQRYVAERYIGQFVVWTSWFVLSASLKVFFLISYPIFFALCPCGVI